MTISILIIICCIFSATPLTLDECTDIARTLEKKPENAIEKFAERLQISVDDLENLKKKHTGTLRDWRLIMKLIFRWEENTAISTNQLPHKQKMATILKDILSDTEIFRKLDPPSCSKHTNIL